MTRAATPTLTCARDSRGVVRRMSDQQADGPQTEAAPPGAGPPPQPPAAPGAGVAAMPGAAPGGKPPVATAAGQSAADQVDHADVAEARRELGMIRRHHG